MENLDNLLDMNLDDLADLPEFLVFTPGAYRCTVNATTKKIGDHPAVEFKFKLIETVEIDATATAPEAGAETSVAYMLDNEFGQGNFKKVMKPICEQMGQTNLRVAVEALNGMEVMAVLKTRQNKDKTQTYQEIVSLNLL